MYARVSETGLDIDGRNTSLRLLCPGPVDDVDACSPLGRIHVILHWQSPKDQLPHIYTPVETTCRKTSLAPQLIVNPN